MTSIIKDAQQLFLTGQYAQVLWKLQQVLALVEMAYDKAQAAFEDGLRFYQAAQGNYIGVTHLIGRCLTVPLD